MRFEPTGTLREASAAFEVSELSLSLVLRKHEPHGVLFLGRSDHQDPQHPFRSD